MSSDDYDVYLDESWNNYAEELLYDVLLELGYITQPSHAEDSNIVAL